MSKFSKSILALLVAAALAACQSTPKPAPQAAPEAQPAAVGNTVGDTPAAAPVVEAQPVDKDQLAYEDAIAALKSDHAESALILLTRLRRDASEKPRLFTNLGLAYFQLQQYPSAEKAFRQAIARDAEDAVAWNHLGILLRHKGDFQEALKAYQKAIEIDANYARAQLNLGILFDLYLQDLEKALQQYRKYQALTSAQDEQVAGWIIDIERRLNIDSTQGQG